MIVNFPGSKKAVVECFEAIQSIIPHAIELIIDAKTRTIATHRDLQKDFKFPAKVKEESKTSPIAVSVSSKLSEVLDISDLLDKSSTSMDEVKFNSHHNN